jgi:hypothetical protein
MAILPIRYFRLRGKENNDILRRVSESGTIWYNSTKKTLNVMDGDTLGGFALAYDDLSNVSTANFLAKLEAAGGGTGSASITVSDSAPTDNIRSGSIWLNTTNGKLYVYYFDGDSFQWIQPSQASWLTGGGGSGSGTVNSSPAEGRLAYYAQPGDTIDNLSNLTWLNDGIEGKFTVQGKIEVTGQKNRIRFHWDSLANLQAEVNPATWHGMIAHCHLEGRIYYAHNGQWIPVPLASDIPAQYSLPAATNSTRGGVTIPNVAISGLTNTSGTLGLAIASLTQLGGVYVDGATISVNGSGVISVNPNALGETITVGDSLPLNPDQGSAWFDTVTGIFLIYTGEEWVQPSTPGYSLPTASNTVLGGVKIDNTSITINENNVISVVNFSDLVTPTSIVSFTNKSISFTNNTITGTLAEFNVACSDADFVSIAGTQTLTNKTLTSPTLTTPTISAGALNNTSTISDGTTTYSIGYRIMPKSNYVAPLTLDTADIGKFIYQTGGLVIIPVDTTVNLVVGTVITIINSGTSNITIQAQAGVTLRQADSIATGNRTLTSYGMATVIKVENNTWYITGAGVA